MKNLKQELQNLPQVSPREEFVSYLQASLIEKHLKRSAVKRRNWFFTPSIALGGALVLILLSIITLGYPRFSKQEKLNDSTNLQFNSGEKTTGEAITGELRSSPSTQTGYLRKSKLPDYLYQLEQDGKIIYFVGSSQNLEPYLNNLVTIEGRSNIDYNNKIQLITVDQIRINK